MVCSFNVNDKDQELLKYLNSIGFNERSGEIRRAIRNFLKTKKGGV